MRGNTARWLSVPSCILLGGCMSPGAAPNAVRSQWALNATPLDRSAPELDNNAQEHLAWAKTYRNRVAGVAGSRTIENTLVPYNWMMMHLDAAQSECAVFARVHPDQAVRRAAEESELAVAKRLSELAVDRELYDAFQALDTSRADRETQYVVYKILRHFRRNGVDQSAETRTRISELQGEITELTQAIVWFRPEHELDAWYKLPDLERRLLIGRYDVAQLLGYSTWGDYVTADTMIESPTGVQSFVQRVVELSRGAAERECAVLRERARESTPGATVRQEFDAAECTQLAAKQRDTYDPLLAEARSYFGLPDVLGGLFEITQRLFGVSYRRVHGLNLWHEDVTAWDVYDGDEHIGRFYLDLGSREGKWAGAKHFTYRTGIAGVCLPQSVVVCSFGPGYITPEGIALLEHAEVAGLFSAFGHMLHNILGGHRRWMGSSGISNEADFVQVPGKVMKEWCYDPEVLLTFAKHYKTREPMFSSIAQHVCRASAVGKCVGTYWRAFDVLSALSPQQRPPGKLDDVEVMAALQGYCWTCDGANGRHFQSPLQDLGCYPSGCYAGLWSDMVAADILTRFQREGMLNPKTGRLYRRTVLEAGGSKKAEDLVKDFLGRTHSLEAFQRWLERP